MNEATYRREYDKSSLIINQQLMTSEEYFQQQMILENCVEGLLPCSLHTFNGENQMFYDISGKQTIECIFEKRQMQAEDIRGLLFGIGETLKHMKEFLLDENYLLLLPKHIYLNLSKEQVYLCFCPFEKGDFTKSIIELAEYLLEHTNHEDSEAVFLSYQFYRRVKENDYPFLQVIEELIKPKKENYTEQAALQAESPKEAEDFFLEEEDMDEGDDETDLDRRQKNSRFLFYFSMFFMLAGLLYGSYNYFSVTQNGTGEVANFWTSTAFLSAVAGFVLGVILFGFSIFYYCIQKKREKEFIDKKNSRREETLYEEKEESAIYNGISEDSYEEDNSIEEFEQTVLLAENCYKEERCLVSMDRKKTVIQLNDFPFIIGKMEGKADYVLSEKSVSRMHVRFTYKPEEDTVYMEDLNSTNGTFHNGIRLDANESVPIFAEDEIRIGKKVFRYQ